MSEPQPTQEPTPEQPGPNQVPATASTEAHDLRLLLEVVLEALTLPYDTVGYDRRILNRAELARTIAVATLTDDPCGIAWNAYYLRKLLGQEQAEADRQGETR